MTEQEIIDAIVAARKVQDFIWGEQSFMFDNYFDKENWVRVFQKRVDKINTLDFNNTSWKIELRKRLLQQAALSVQAIELLNNIPD